MELNKRPNLLILNDLLGPIKKCSVALCGIKEEQRDGLTDVLRQGVFVLAVAHVETMIVDTLEYYLSLIPQKMEKENLSVAKDDLLAHPFDLIDVQIQKFLQGMAYKSLDDILRYFCDVLSLNVDAKALVAPLREIKATRNILLHNNLISNNTYCETAGDGKRATKPGVKLDISKSYLDASICQLSSFVADLDSLICIKYAGYTRLAAIKQLWSYTFKSPIMSFDDFWVVDEKNDCIGSMKKGKYEDSISGSETIFLDVWRVHFNAYRPDLKLFNMHNLDQSNQAKLFYLLSVFSYLWLY